jgi:hypothetical protein
MRRRAVLAAGCILAAAALAAQTATPAPKPVRTPGSADSPKRSAKAKKKSGPPLDFTGVWVLDAQASSGVGPNMEQAVLSVRQNGNRIWIEQIETNRLNILAEEIVVDGKLYEKSLGRGQKGTLEAAWGKDGTSLWLQAVARTDENPTAAMQRMIWRLRDGGKTWTRQTRTIQPGGAKDTFLVFRKREGKTK